MAERARPLQRVFTVTNLCIREVVRQTPILQVVREVHERKFGEHAVSIGKMQDINPGSHQTRVEISAIAENLEHRGCYATEQRR